MMQCHFSKLLLMFLHAAAAVPAAAAAGRPVTDTTISTAARPAPPDGSNHQLGIVVVKVKVEEKRFAIYFGICHMK